MGAHWLTVAVKFRSPQDRDEDVHHDQRENRTRQRLWLFLLRSFEREEHGHECENELDADLDVVDAAVTHLRQTDNDQTGEQCSTDCVRCPIADLLTDRISEDKGAEPRNDVQCDKHLKYDGHALMLGDRAPEKPIRRWRSSVVALAQNRDEEA